MKEWIFRMKRIVSIQDISCFGKCSLTVALPIISAMGIEACPVPTAVLSTHTGGFTGYTYRDLTNDILSIADHWKSLDLKFDAVATGYLGSFEQIKIVSDFFDKFKTDDNLIIVDPVMGDKGHFYAGFTEDFALEMKKLCSKADVIVPNLTEAAQLLDEDYIDGGYNEEYIKNLLIRLSQGVMSYNRETGEFSSYFNENIPGYFHSTGDIFSSTLCGALVKGFDMSKAVRIAVDFTVDCIKHTVGSEKEHWYAVKFEECIPDLIEMIK